MAARLSNIIIEGARIIFRDFTGEANKFNDDRTFGVVLEPELAEKLQADGWPVKWLEPRDEEGDRTPFLRVKVYFGKSPMQVILISGGVKKELNENNINILNWVNIANADVVIRPYVYDFNGKTGVKPYLKALWVTAEEDSFEAKYKNIPYATDKPSNDDEEGLPFN